MILKNVNLPEKVSTKVELFFPKAFEKKTNVQ